MARDSYIRAYEFKSNQSQEAIKQAEENYASHITKASEELRKLLPDDYSRPGMSQAAALVMLSYSRKRRFR